MKTALAQSALTRVCRMSRLCLPTILVAHTLADGDAALIVRVLEHHDLGQLDAEAISHQFGELTMAVASQKFDRVGSHVRPISCVVV
jgi:hypothetical protein